MIPAIADSRLHGNDRPILMIIESKSKTFLTFCFCFLIGIALGSLYNRPIEFVYLYLSLFIAVSLLIAGWGNKKTLFLVTCSLLLAGGFFRYSLALPPSDFNLPGGKQTLTAFVAAEPDVRQDSVRYIVEMQNAKFRMQNGFERVYIKSGLYPRYEYGEVLSVTCRLERPAPFNGFRYDMYLAKFGVFAVCREPEIDKIGAGVGNQVLTKILKFKNTVSERVNVLWHEPYASFVAGLLYGARGGLGNLTEDFSRTGVSHIIAISGYNISIIAKYLLIICAWLWIPRQKAFYLVTAIIAVFVLFVGASGSVVRAGVMGFLVLLAGQIGRLNRVGNALALSAVLMLAHNPLLLFWDAGFQLSFLATLGIVYLPPLFEGQTKKILLPNQLKEIVVTTCAAIIATLPLILFQFGRLSVVAPVVNVLILWIIPSIMFLGFASIVLSFVFAPIGQLFSLLTFILMKYVTTVVGWFSSLAWSAVDLRLPWWGMLGLYVLGLGRVIILYQKKKFTPPTKSDARAEAQ